MSVFGAGRRELWCKCLSENGREHGPGEDQWVCPWICSPLPPVSIQKQLSLEKQACFTYSKSKTQMIIIVVIRWVKIPGFTTVSAIYNLWMFLGNRLYPILQGRVGLPSCFKMACWAFLNNTEIYRLHASVWFGVFWIFFFKLF